MGVEGSEFATPIVYDFPCHRWLDEEKGDRALQRLLEVDDKADMLEDTG